MFDSSNWNVPQTVTVTGLDDGIDDGDRTYLIQSAPAVSADSLYNGLDAADVSITNVARSPLPPPAPPVATADRYTVAFGKVLSVVPAGVLANDATASGQPMTAVLARQTSHGVVALTPDGAFTYTPASGFAGVDRFAYAASNSGGRSAPADVTVVVEAPPIRGPPAHRLCHHRSRRRTQRCRPRLNCRRYMKAPRSSPRSSTRQVTVPAPLSQRASSRPAIHPAPRWLHH